MKNQVVVVNNYIEKISDFAVLYAPKLLGDILVLLTGLWIIKLITKGVGKSLENSSMDQSLVLFLRSITNIILKVLLAITVMGMIGIEMTSFVAIIGTAGLVFGLALS